MKYVAYIRCSSDEQAESGLGLLAQVAAIEKSLGYKPDSVFSDEGISGKRADRPGLLQALNALKRGDVLIVAKRDRLARDTFLSCWIEKEVKKRGARILSTAGEGTDADGPADILMRRMVDAFAEYERLIIGQRTKAALAQKRARGEKTGGDVPFGFSVDAAGLLTPNHAEQEIISKIKELQAAGYSLRAIAGALNDEGFTTRRGTAWRHQYIAGILRAA